MISSATATQSSTSSNALTNATNDNVSQEQFLQLLIAQLQNQDPLNPVENQEFVAELATFSSLEQQQQQTDLLSQLVESNQSTNTSQALSLIGTDVMTNDTSFYYTTGDTIDFDFLATESGVATVYLTNAAGSSVAYDAIDVSSTGQHTYTFDPGEALSQGSYTLSIVSSVDAEGNQDQFETYMMGGVEGVNFLDGEPMLSVNGNSISLGTVQAIYERDSEL